MALMNSLCLTQDDLYHPVSQAYPAIAPPSFPCRSGSLIQIDCCSQAEESLTEKSYLSPSRWTKEILCKSRQGRVTIDVLPNDVLLEIFHWHVDDPSMINAWHTLVHVSRKWRCVVFDSPRRLNLQLVCSARTPVREMLTIWPPLPILIWQHYHSACNEDNIIAALEHHDRVCEIQLEGVPSSLLEKLLAVMQEPFSALAFLALEARGNPAPVVPDSFLGGSAPHLRRFSLTHIPIPFPVLRKLFLSASNLAHLILYKIPHSGYLSPEAMVTCLSMLTRLESLHFEFESPRSRPYRENRRPPLLTRTLLPALRGLLFTGVSEYLEDLVARIDAPLLRGLNITFFHQLIFDTPRLAQFISRSSLIQGDKAHNAHVTFSFSGVIVSLPGLFANGRLELGISCRQSDWQLSALAQVCSSSLSQAFIPTVEHLHISENGYSLRPRWQDDVENCQWLELLHPFTAVKNLFLSKELAPRIAPVLQELVGERANEVFPALQCIFLEGLHPGGVPKEIRQFIDARNHSGHTTAVIPWTREAGIDD